MKKYIAALALMAIPLISFASIDKDLRYGSSGPEVTELQEYLNANGFLATQPTGNFYSLTRKAVVAYQTSVNLPATGFVGPLTRGVINKDLAGNTSPEEEQTVAIATPSNDTSVLQKQLNDLLAQVQTLVTQQKATTDATLQTNQAITQVVQNTAPSFGSVQPVVVPVKVEKITIQTVGGDYPGVDQNDGQYYYQYDVTAFYSVQGENTFSDEELSQKMSVSTGELNQDSSGQIGQVSTINKQGYGRRITFLIKKNGIFPITFTIGGVTATTTIDTSNIAIFKNPDQGTNVNKATIKSIYNITVQ